MINNSHPMPSGAGERRPDGPLRAVTWNVQRAGAERTARQVTWLAGCNAHVLALTEVGTGQVARLTAALTAAGFATCHHPGHWAGSGVVLAFRGVQARFRPDLKVPELPHRCAVAAVTDGQAAITVMALYVPSRGVAERRNIEKRAFQAAVSTALPSIVAATRHHGPMLVLGDLNVVEPGHQPSRPVFGEWEYDFYRSFGENGLVDAYRACQPAEHHHSWFGRQGAGYRLDHAFVSGSHAHRLQACRYLDEPRLAGLSDHSALEVALHRN